MYNTNENGQHEFNADLKIASVAETFVADFLTSKGFSVLNVTTDRKTDLICTKNGVSKSVEVKQNYKKNDYLYLESHSDTKKQNSGWMYTTISDYIIFIDNAKTEIIMTDTLSLRAAFKQVIALMNPDYPDITLYNPSYQDNYNGTTGSTYRSACYFLPIEELERHGAKIKKFDVSTFKQETLTEAQAEILEEDTKFQNERDKWLEKLNDGFLGDDNAKKMINRFS